MYAVVIYSCTILFYFILFHTYENLTLSYHCLSAIFLMATGALIYDKFIWVYTCIFLLHFEIDVF